MDCDNSAPMPKAKFVRIHTEKIMFISDVCIVQIHTLVHKLIRRRMLYLTFEAIKIWKSLGEYIITQRQSTRGCLAVQSPIHRRQRSWAARKENYIFVRQFIYNMREKIEQLFCLVWLKAELQQPQSVVYFAMYCINIPMTAWATRLC